MLNSQPDISANLDFLLHERLSFVASRIDGINSMLEIGAGRGLTQNYLKVDSLVKTDVIKQPWIDVVANGEGLPFEDGSFDAVLMVAVLHHMAFPLRALQEAQRVVRLNGKIFILEPHGSAALRLLLYAANHEYFDPTVNPYAEENCKSSIDPSIGNNAIGDLIFSDHGQFRKRFPGLRVDHHKISEFLLFANSGGVNVSLPYIPLPTRALTLVKRIDETIVARWPNYFGLSQEIVLQRISEP